MEKLLRQPVGVSLLETLPEARVFGDRGVHGDSCTTDASDVRPGDIYFALEGDCEDTAAAAQRAVAEGASAVVTDTYVPVFGVPQFVVADARVAYGEFCQQLVGDPSRSLTLAAVAGAHGKTTVGRLLTGILKRSGVRCGCLLDNLEYDGLSAAETHRPAPGAARIARWLGDASAEGCQSAVLELGPRALRQQSHAGAKLGVLCVTNQNYDRVGGVSPDGERRLVAQLASDLAPFSTLVLNANDPDSMRLLAERDGLTLTYAIGKTADVRGEVVESGAGGQVLMVTINSLTVAVGLPVAGQALALDYLAAIATAHAMGVDLVDAAAAVETAPKTPGVMQPSACGQAFAVRIDQGCSPERVRAALNAARSMATGRVISVLPENAAASACSVATALADLVVCPRPDAADEEDSNTRHVEDRFSAVALALGLAEPGDMVVLSGAPKPPASRRAEETLVQQLLELRLSNTKEPVTMPQGG